MLMELLKDVVVMLRGMWKYKWLMLGVAWIVGALGWVAVFTMPSQYEATARVYLDTTSRLREVVSSLGMEPNVESRVFLVRQALVGRPQLEAVARATDLDLRATNEEEMEGLIQSLQEKISIGSGRRGQAETLYNITFTDRDRATAIAVVDALLNNFVENVLEKKDSDTERTSSFLDQQLSHYRNLLGETESALEAFKRENPAYVFAGDGQGFFERMQRAELDRERLRSELAVEIDKRSELRRQLTGVDPFVPDNDEDGASAFSIPGSATSAQIRELEDQRRAALLQYTDQHPDVVALNEQIGMLKKQLNDELASLASSVDGVQAANNPLYVEIQLQLSTTNLKITALNSQISEANRKISELRSSVDTAPELDRRHTELTRDYQNYLALYSELLDTSERKRIGDVGDQQDVVTFNVINPPRANLQPVSPNRQLLLAAVLVLALGAGVGVGFLAYQLNPTFSDSQTLQDSLGVPVIGSVAYSFPAGGVMARRIDLTSFLVAGAGLVVVIVLSMLVSEQITVMLSSVFGSGA